MSPETTSNLPKSTQESPERIVLSFTREELNKVLQNPKHTPEDILAFFEKDFGSEFAKDAGVFEKYSIREHTGMMLNQYRKYFYDNELPQGVDKDFLEVLFALHDIGKPEAIAHGDKYKQHEYTVPVLHNALKQLGYTEKDVAIAVAVIDGDTIGAFLKGGDVSGSAEAIVHSADSAGMSVDEFWKLLTIYYQSDAGSYTNDAGGKPSLDHLFTFDPQNGVMQFSQDTERKMNQLYNEVRRVERERPLKQKELREFSRMEDTENRSKLVESVRAKRKEYFDRKRGTQEKITSLKEVIEEHTLTLEEVTEEYEKISHSIETQKANKILEIANYFKLKKLREQLGNVEQKKEGVASDLERNCVMLDQLDQIMNDQSTLGGATSEVKDYYTNLSETYTQLEAEKYGRDVGNMMREHSAFFFHAINTEADDAQKVNGVINPNIPREDRLKILLSLEPTISASTVKHGTEMKHDFTLWSRSGVILSGGHITEAGRNDIASQSQGVDKRNSTQARYKELRSVSEAIEDRGTSYNELIIREPKIAGYYLWVNADREWPISLNEIRQKELQEAEALGLPLYTVIDGRVIESFLVNEGTELMPGADEVTPKSLLKSPQISLDETRRKELREEVLNDTTFNMEKFEEKIPEVAYIDGLRAGKDVLERLTHPHGYDYLYASNQQFKEYIDNSRKEGMYRGAITGDEIPLTDMTDTDYTRMSNEFQEAHKEYIGTKWLPIGRNSTLYDPENLDKRIKDVKELPTFIQDVLEKVMLTEGQDGIVIRRTVGMCYGLADALDSSPTPDHKTAEELRGVAEQYMRKEDFEALKVRRLDEKGRIRISPEEIM